MLRELAVRALVWMFAFTALGAVEMPQPAAARDASKVGIVSHVKVVSDKVEDVSSPEAWRKSYITDGMSDHESEAERGAAVVALGRIGDTRAVEPLSQHFRVGYSTVVVYWIQDAIDAALRSITGEQNVVGKDEWLRWNQR